MTQTQERPDKGSNSGTPRWVKVFGIVFVIVVLLLIVTMLLPGGHGPGRHLQLGEAGGVEYSSHGLLKGGNS